MHAYYRINAKGLGHEVVMRYKGKNRRVHICFITKNREYHIRAGECIAVRDRVTSVWIAGHVAIGMRMRPLPPGASYIGKELEFYSADSRIVTSRVVDILRPNKNEVDTYSFVHGLAPEDETLTG
jgi:hypothetical protein